MPEANRKQNQKPESDLGMSGFETFFENPTAESAGPEGQAAATAVGDSYLNGQIAKLIDKMTELLTFNIDQRVETARISNQLIENQRQLVATQQILIRLMERSIELTRHITAIEEKLPAVFEIPAMVEQLREKVAQIEAVEID
ncbi:MAG: hypothetical protein K2X27_14360 [Candidatus Obscuribacterales bacterium]|nr:hypothetical protein [Candidatus Obscuribacterales bacterium]